MGIITESVSASPGWGVAKRAQCTRLVTRDGRLRLQCAFHCGAPRSLSLQELRCYAIKTASAQLMGAC